MRTYLGIFFLVIIISGCGNAIEDEVKPVVLTYTNMLAKSYLSEDTNQLESLTTAEWLDELHKKLKSSSRNGMQLFVSMRSIEFAEIQQTTSEDVIVVTNESWDYRYVDFKSGRTEENQSTQIIFRYQVVMQDGSWRVAHVDRQPVPGQKGENERKYDQPQAPKKIFGIPPGDSEQILKDTVSTYLVLLADGYRKQNMTPLAHSATQKRARKAYHHMSSMGEGRVRMDPRLQKISITSVTQVSEKFAEVKTEEQWEYIYYSTDTGEKTYANTSEYALTYSLVPGDAKRWFVDDITIETIKEGPGEGILPFVDRPHDMPLKPDR